MAEVNGATQMSLQDTREAVDDIVCKLQAQWGKEPAWNSFFEVCMLAA